MSVVWKYMVEGDDWGEVEACFEEILHLDGPGEMGWTHDRVSSGGRKEMDERAMRIMSK